MLAAEKQCEKQQIAASVEYAGMVAAVVVPARNEIYIHPCLWYYHYL